MINTLLKYIICTMLFFSFAQEFGMFLIVPVFMYIAFATAKKIMNSGAEHVERKIPGNPHKKDDSKPRREA